MVAFGIRVILEQAPDQPVPLPPCPPRSSAQGTMATPESLGSALALLDDVKDDFGTLEEALRHVAVRTSRSFSSLRSAYHRSRRGVAKRHRQFKLGAEQEAVLVDVAQACSVNNVALSMAQLRQLAERKWGVSVSRRWVGRFVGRHRGMLSQRACEALAGKRAGREVFDGVVDFCTELKDFLPHYHFPPHAVFNYDETRVVQKGERLALRRVETANKERANARSTRHQNVASLLTCVAADGSVLLSVYILKGNFGDGDEATVAFTMERAPRVTRGTWPRFYVWNDSGYLDAAVFKSVLVKVAEEFHAKYPGLQALLYGDQLAAHRRADTVEFALGLGLFLYSLPKYTSHITQPLDEAPFAALQADRRRRNEAAVMDGMLTNTDTRDALLMAAYEAERRAFSRPVIIGAFRRRGLWPFNADLMQVNVRANLGLVETGQTAIEAARHAASEVIQAAQERVDDARAGSSKGKARVARGVVHSPFLLLQQHRQMEEQAAKEGEAKVARQEERERRKEHQAQLLDDKAAAREKSRCRVCAGKVRRGGSAWVGCRCNAFWVCPACAKTMQAGQALAGHLTVCGEVAEGDSEGDGGSGGECGSSDTTE